MGEEDNRDSSLSLKRIELSLDSLPYRLDVDLYLSNTNMKDTFPICHLNHHRGKNNYTNPLTDQVLYVLAII